MPTKIAPAAAPVSFDQAMLEQSNLIICDATQAHTPDAAARLSSAAAFLANLEGLGFALERESFHALTHMSIFDQSLLYSRVWPVLLQQVGAHRTWKPMYPNFPKQVMEASNAELFANALLHYAGDVVGLRILPDYPVDKRPPLRDAKRKPVVLALGSTEQALARMARWLDATQAWSPAQAQAVRAGLAVAIEHDVHSATKMISDATLSNRENRAVVAAEWLTAMHAARSGSSREDNKRANILALAWPIQGMSVNDVLRTSVALSGGDVSLAEPTKFKSMARGIRRDLMQALNGAVATTQTAEEDVFQRRETWLRLGEKLHPGEFEAKAPMAFLLFDAVRNQKAPVSLMGKLDRLLGIDPAKANFDELAAMFAERPGALARQLHRLLLWANTRGDEVVAAFKPVADKCSTSILLTLAHHFETQHARTVRTVLPKGSLGKIRMTEHVPQAVDAESAAELVDLCNQTLIGRFSPLPALGNCFLDEALDQIPTPFALRSASKALKTVPRGSRLPMEDANITRMFLWWSESDPAGLVPSTSRIDIDLSCVVLDEDYEPVSSCTYYSLRGQGLTHSGDITSAPRGACEFIDIEHDKLPKNARFVVMSINSFTDQPYAEVPECFAGWMPRKSAKRGEIFEPRLVANRFDLTSDSKAVMPMVMDLRDKCVLWTDMPYSANFGYNNVSVHQESLRNTVEGLMNLSRPTLGQLFRLHVAARGTLVDDIKQADVAFTLAPQDKVPGVNAYQALEILSDWQVEADASAQAPKLAGKAAKIK